MSDKKLAELNAAVDKAVAERTKWLDEEMVKRSKFKVGDEIYDLDKCILLGVVVELYRYHRDDIRYDTTLQTDYRYSEKGGRCIDNTSRHGFISLGTKEEVRQKLLEKAKQL